MANNLTMTSAGYDTSTQKFGSASLNAGYGTAAAPLVPAGLNFTCSCWVKITSPGVLKVAYAQANAFWIGIDASGFAKANFGYAGTQVNITTSASIGDNVWHHLELDIDSAAGAKFFVDGLLKGSDATTPGAAAVQTSGGNAKPLEVRSFEQAGTSVYDWPGNIDEAALFGAVLHTSGFTAPVAAYTGAEANLIGLWHLDSNGNDSTGGTPATAITMTGPSTGIVGSPSAAFTVGANGIIAGTVIVTMADGGAGGTFTPTTVSINSGAPTGTFTYTAASAGAKTISETNNGGLANAGNITYTASVSATKLPNDPGLFYSPYNWLVSGSAAKTINSGAYFKCLFTGATCILNFDVSNVSSPNPRILVRVDRQTFQYATLSATITATMPSGPTNTTHLLEVLVDSTDYNVNRWNAPQNTAVVLTGITLATLGDSLIAVNTKPNNLIVYGDSITEGLRTMSAGQSPETLDASAYVCWPLALGEYFDAEVGVIGFGATGISVSGQGNVPALPSSYSYLWSGQARTFAPAPKYCIWLEGTNDGATNTQAAGISVLNAMLSAMPTTQFILFRPLNGTAQEANLQAIQVGCSAPGRVRYISTAGFWSSADSPDALHPYGYADLAFVAPKMASAILTTATTTPRTVTLTLTTDGTTLAAGLNGLKWAFFDSPQPQSFAAPVAQGSGATTSVGGVFVVTVNTTLPSGGVGWLIVSNSDGTTTQGAAEIAFDGPVVVV